MSRAARVAYWLAPIAFCTLLYWYGLKVWFLRDDFAWLGLQDGSTTLRSLLQNMFTPYAQGTIRPWSDRAFFLIFSSLFGLHSFPFRLFVFFNQALNLILLAALTRKLTGSSLAGIAAPLLWLSNVALDIPMAWSAAYNEIQFATFFLAGLYLFVRYTESDERKFYVAQWITFLLAFGSLELNVVYPGVLAAYSLARSRKHLWATLPMFAVSVLYYAVHRWATGPNKSYYYALIFGTPVLKVLGKYWATLFNITAEATIGLPHRLGNLLLAVMTAAILGFVIRQALHRRFLPLFFLSLYLITLAPFLLISRHMATYYQVIPSIGLAMLGAYALSVAWRSLWKWRVAIVVLIAAYAIPSIVDIRNDTRFYYDSSQRIRHLLAGVASAEKLHPGKTIVLTGLDDQLFWDCIRDSPFRLLGPASVLVAPQNRPLIHVDPHTEPMDRFFLPLTTAMLKRQELVVYSAENPTLRNVTREYSEAVLAQGAAPELSAQVDLGVPYFDGQLGEGWYQAEDGYRWMGRQAVLYLPGPSHPAQKLHLHGAYVDRQRAEGSLLLAVIIDGQKQPARLIEPGRREFEFDYDLPSELLGKRKIEIGLAVDKTFFSGSDQRALGLLLKDVGLR